MALFLEMNICLSLEMKIWLLDTEFYLMEQSSPWASVLLRRDSSKEAQFAEQGEHAWDDANMHGVGVA